MSNKFLIVFLISNMFNILKQLQGQIISLNLTANDSYTSVLTNSQIIVINYSLRNKSTFSSDYELPPIVYKLHLNLPNSTSNETLKTELSRILPLLIYTRDDWTGLAVELPFFFMGNHVFTQRQGTICPMNLQMDVVNKSINDSDLPKVSVTTIMTSSPKPINFTFKAEIQENATFYLNSTLTKSIQPFAPLIFRFKFDDNTTIAKLIVSSNDNRCMIIAAEFTRCPTLTTFDSKIEFGPLTQRMRKNGTLILEKANYRNGELFIVFEVQPSENICEDDDTYNASDPWGVGKLKDFIYHTLDDTTNLTKTVTIHFVSVSITPFDWLINAFIGLCLPYILTLFLIIIFFPTFLRKFYYECIRIFNLIMHISRLWQSIKWYVFDILYKSNECFLYV